MIIGNFTNGNPTGLNGYCDRMIGMALSVPKSPTTPNLSISIPENCCNCLPVFGGGAGNQNDKSTFLYRRAIATDTIVIKLLKDSVEVATITDNTYGTYYDFGTWTTFTGQEHYKGFTIDWDLVYNAFGSGEYTINAEHTIIGSSYTLTSQSFDLNLYNDVLADGTVSFEWVQNGRIVNKDFNYNGMNLTQYIRVKGVFGFYDPKMVKDEVIYSDYKSVQVQDSLDNNYTFKSELIDSYISDLLIKDMMLSDTIKVNDFNIFNHNTYVDFEVRQDEIKLEPIDTTNKAKIELTFKDRYKNSIKRG